VTLRLSLAMVATAALGVACAQPPAAQVREWRLESQPVASIGVAEGDERYMFNWIIGVLKLADGRILVGERDGSIRIFGADGRHLARFGGQGEGPGEFRFLRSLLPYRGDSIAAADAGLRRISIFDANGRFGRSVNNSATYVRAPGTIPSQSCCLVSGTFPDGSFLVELPETLPNAPGGPRHGTVTLVRLAADGSSIDTIGSFAGSRLMYDASAPNRIRAMHLTGRFTYAVIGDRVYGGNGEESHLEVVAADGGRPDTIPLGLPRSAVTAAMRSALADTIRAEYARTPRERPVEHYLSGEFPDRLPAFGRVLSDVAGNLWLAASPYAGTAREMDYLVFSTAGEQIARIRLPAVTAPIWLDRDEVVMVQQDALDVEYVNVYRILR
jgi:hypothetical protein